MSKWLVIMMGLLLPLSTSGHADRREIEEAFNRHNGPPLYRYYDVIPAHENSYESQLCRPDANAYWASRYYGNSNPDPYEERWLDRELMDIEEQKQ